MIGKIFEIPAIRIFFLISLLWISLVCKIKELEFQICFNRLSLFLYILSACTHLVLFSFTSDIVDPLIFENIWLSKIIKKYVWKSYIFPFFIQDFMFTDFPNSKGQSRIFRFNKNISESYIDKYIFSSLR